MSSLDHVNLSPLAPAANAAPPKCDIELVQRQERESVSEEERHSSPVNANARPAVFHSTAREILFIVTATMSVSLPSFLQGTTLVISATIQRDLHMTTAQLTWMTASSALTSGSFLLFFGRFADMFGRRILLLSSLFIFTVFALGTGFSDDPITLIVLNAIMGLTSASAIPSAQGMLGSIYDRPSKRKNYAFACFSSGNHLGFVFGSIFSGIAAHLLGWRASFWLLAIIYLVVFLVACFVCPADDSSTPPVTLNLLKQFDVVATLLVTTGIALFAAGISIGPTAPHGWRTSYVIAFLVAGVCMIAAFVWWECRFRYPLMPMDIWRDRTFSLLLVILLLGFGSFPAVWFFCSLYLQDLFGYSSLITALCLLPAAISGIFVNIFAGSLLHRISNKLLMGIGAAAFVIAFLLVAVQRSGDSYWAFTFPALAIVVIGTDLEFNVVNMYVVSALPRSQQSIASSVFQTTIKLAVTVGLGVFAAIFTSVAENPSESGYYAHDPYEPYAAVFWVAVILSFISLLLVPFVRLKTQGHEE